ncbi:MAG: hypothetical protein LBJ65_27305 [Burkholderia sp.]|jgi:hypothetical protein|nr:hypothetical protein [Burkholderia sp.]MDR0245323.1 hypothetical protein [Burkholderia sp.]
MAEPLESLPKTFSAARGPIRPPAATADFPFDNLPRIRENPASEGESH